MYIVKQNDLYFTFDRHLGIAASWNFNSYYAYVFEDFSEVEEVLKMCGICEDSVWIGGFWDECGDDGECDGDY